MSEKLIEIKSLVGKHTLSGVDEITRKIKNYFGDSFESCQCINFVLDGKTYTAIEDPDDGYRSALDKIIESNEKIENTFAPVEVIVLYREKYQYGECEILDFVDIKNGKRVLEIGTEDTDDYYPCFVACWMPENLSINEGKNGEKDSQSF